MDLVLTILRKLPGADIKKLRPFIFYTCTIIYLEFIYRLWCIGEIDFGFIFSIVFSLSAGALLFLLSGLSNERLNRILAVFFISFTILCYCTQLIYYCIFQTPLSICSLAGALDVMQFMNVVISTVLHNIIAVLLLLIPLPLLLFADGRLTFQGLKRPLIYYALIFCVLSYGFAILCVNLTAKTGVSQYTLYYRNFSAELSVRRLGLLTTMRLDFEKGVLGMRFNDDTEKTFGENSETTVSGGMPAAGRNETVPSAQSESTEAGSTSDEESTETTQAPVKIYNTMDINFDDLIANEKNTALIGMHKYFSSVTPSKTNEYTGLFKGCNLILITAEGFSPYALSPELTPTLYKMANEGFVFKNFYNPVWGVSTSDGEYVACTGLIPKSGVWSFARSGKNYMPFVMGNQFKKLGYPVRAYHDHTYTYYKRNISHPNMGYDYKGVGNGLEIKKTWPESDLEMIEATAGDYIGPNPFHTYYMTVSGHLQYSFSGNYIAQKNKALVSGLPYSNAAKAYISCNLELEFAMKALIEKLEKAGIADKTVIAVSADHYPYGLPRECIDELAGHKVENNFELYKSTFILWKKGMKTVVVDKPCASLDIIPTLSNLFGLEYDSRLLMGSDILSDTPPLVIFSNYSWITDRAMYNAPENSVTFTDGTQKDKKYINHINNMVAKKFEFSAKILDMDYYNVVFSQRSGK